MILENVNIIFEVKATVTCGSLTDNKISQDLHTSDLPGFLTHEELRTLAKET